MKIKRENKVLRRDRKPGEALTRANAIRSHCILCSGNNAAEVTKCQVPECWLYPLRFGSRMDPELEREKEKYGNNFPNEIQY
jgi:hypothetical protein